MIFFSRIQGALKTSQFQNALSAYKRRHVPGRSTTPGLALQPCRYFVPDPPTSSVSSPVRARVRSGSIDEEVDRQIAEAMTRHESAMSDCPPKVTAFLRGIESVLMKIPGQKLSLNDRLNRMAEMAKIQLVQSFPDVLEDTPLTGRSRLPLWDHESLFKICEEADGKMIREIREEEVRDSKQLIVKDHNHLSLRLNRMMRKILEANNLMDSFPKEKWKVTIVNHKNMITIFNNPNGKIYLSNQTLLDVLTNDDEVAYSLAHEMGHIVLRHHVEWICNIRFMTYTNAYLMGAMQAIMPEATREQKEEVMIPLSQTLKDLVIPNEFMYEEEADDVGHFWMAKACFDPRAPSFMWRRCKRRNIQWNDSLGKSKISFDLPSTEVITSMLEDWQRLYIKEKSDFRVVHPPDTDRATSCDQRQDFLIDMRKHSGCHDLLPLSPATFTE